MHDDRRRVKDRHDDKDSFVIGLVQMKTKRADIRRRHDEGIYLSFSTVKSCESNRK